MGDTGNCRHCGQPIVRVDTETFGRKWTHEGKPRHWLCLTGDTVAGPAVPAALTGQVPVSGNTYP